jgi:hypothetical protein
MWRIFQNYRDKVRLESELSALRILLTDAQDRVKELELERKTFTDWIITISGGPALHNSDKALAQPAPDRRDVLMQQLEMTRGSRNWTQVAEQLEQEING